MPLVEVESGGRKTRRRVLQALAFACRLHLTIPSTRPLDYIRATWREAESAKRLDWAFDGRRYEAILVNPELAVLLAIVDLVNGQRRRYVLRVDKVLASWEYLHQPGRTHGSVMLQAPHLYDSVQYRDKSQGHIPAVPYLMARRDDSLSVWVVGCRPPLTDRVSALGPKAPSWVRQRLFVYRHFLSVRRYPPGAAFESCVALLGLAPRMVLPAYVHGGLAEVINERRAWVAEHMPHLAKPLPSPDLPGSPDRFLFFWCDELAATPLPEPEAPAQEVREACSVSA